MERVPAADAPSGSLSATPPAKPHSSPLTPQAYANRILGGKIWFRTLSADGTTVASINAESKQYVHSDRLPEGCNWCGAQSESAALRPVAAMMPRPFVVPRYAPARRCWLSGAGRIRASSWIMLAARPAHRAAWATHEYPSMTSARHAVPFGRKVSPPVVRIDRGRWARRTGRRRPQSEQPGTMGGSDRRDRNE